MFDNLLYWCVTPFLSVYVLTEMPRKEYKSKTATEAKVTSSPKPQGLVNPQVTYSQVVAGVSPSLPGPQPATTATVSATATVVTPSTGGGAVDSAQHVPSGLVGEARPTGHRSPNDGLPELTPMRFPAGTAESTRTKPAKGRSGREDAGSASGTSSRTGPQRSAKAQGEGKGASTPKTSHRGKSSDRGSAGRTSEGSASARSGGKHKAGLASSSATLSQGIREYGPGERATVEPQANQPPTSEARLDDELGGMPRLGEAVSHLLEKGQPLVVDSTQSSEAQPSQQQAWQLLRTVFDTLISQGRAAPPGNFAGLPIPSTSGPAPDAVPPHSGQSAQAPAQPSVGVPQGHTGQPAGTSVAPQADRDPSPSDGASSRPAHTGLGHDEVVTGDAKRHRHPSTSSSDPSSPASPPRRPKSKKSRRDRDRWSAVQPNRGTVPVRQPSESTRLPRGPPTVSGAATGTGAQHGGLGPQPGFAGAQAGARTGGEQVMPGLVQLQSEPSLSSSAPPSLTKRNRKRKSKRSKGHSKGKSQEPAQIPAVTVSRDPRQGREVTSVPMDFEVSVPRDRFSAARITPQAQASSLEQPHLGARAGSSRGAASSDSFSESEEESPLPYRERLAQVQRMFAHKCGDISSSVKRPKTLSTYEDAMVKPVRPEGQRVDTLPWAVTQIHAAGQTQALVEGGAKLAADPKASAYHQIRVGSSSNHTSGKIKEPTALNPVLAGVKGAGVSEAVNSTEKNCRGALAALSYNSWFVASSRHVDVQMRGYLAAIATAAAQGDLQAVGDATQEACELQHWNAAYLESADRATQHASSLVSNACGQALVTKRAAAMGAWEKQSRYPLLPAERDALRLSGLDRAILYQDQTILPPGPVQAVQRRLEELEQRSAPFEHFMVSPKHQQPFRRDPSQSSSRSSRPGRQLQHKPGPQGNPGGNPPQGKPKGAGKPQGRPSGFRKKFYKARGRGQPPPKQ